MFDGELFNTGAEIGAYNPLYWLKVIWSAPRWLRCNFSRCTPRSLFKAAATKLNYVQNKLRGAPRDFGGEAAELFNFKNMTANHVSFVKALYASQFSYIPKTFLGRVVVFTANLKRTYVSESGEGGVAQDSSVFRICFRQRHPRDDRAFARCRRTPRRIYFSCGTGTSRRLRRYPRRRPLPAAVARRPNKSPSVPESGSMASLSWDGRGRMQR